MYNKIVIKKNNTIQIDEEIAKKYINLCKKIAKLESELIPLENMIKEQCINIMKKNNIDSFLSNGINGKYIHENMRKVLDTTKLKTEKPLIYNNYLKDIIVKENLKINI